VFPGEPPKDFSYPELDSSGNPIPGGGKGLRFFIGPKATRYSHRLQIPIEVLEKVRRSEGRLFIWGWVQYRDAFEGTPVHATKICNEIVVTSLKVVNDEVEVALTFPLYGQHNSAD
jgi:hypothetical protein